MIEYLYTSKYTDEYDGLNESLPCKHPEDNCSCDNKRCYLRPYGIAISLYTMGDKYLIPGLMTCSSAYIQKMFSREWIDDWDYEIQVWTLAYAHSRKSDELRAVLLRRICHKISSTDIVEFGGFLEFLEEVPELTCALLKITLQWHLENWGRCTGRPFHLDQDFELS